LNAAIQEKKRFEGALDDAVASGMNAGVEVLMNQVGIRVHNFMLRDLKDPNPIGRAYHPDSNPAGRILSSARTRSGIGTNQGLYRRDHVLGGTL
jgi:hypothetical protein